jgi:hypothetical protein
MDLFDTIFGKRTGADSAGQMPGVQGICAALFPLLPPHWNAVTLTLSVPAHGLGQGLAHSISSPEGHPGVVTPTPELCAAIQKLELVWLEHKATFKRVIVSAQRTGKDWNVQSEYEYGVKADG